MLNLSLFKYTPAGVPDTAHIKVVPTGNYTTGGDTLNLNPSALADPLGLGIIGFPSNPPQTPPIVDQTFFTGAYAGYSASIVPGATLGTYKLQIWNGGVELGAGAYPAGILNQYIAIEVPLS